MKDYLMLVAATLLLAVNFAATKLYQQKTGTGLAAGLKFNVMLGILTAVIFLALNRFKMEWTLYSAGMAALATILCVAYTLLGFRIMSGEKMAMYTFFLMTGGMVVPYIWGLLFLNEEFSWLRTLGLLVIAVSVFITNSDSSKPGWRQLLLLFGVFFLNGFVSVVFKLHQINTMAVPATDFLILNSIAKVVFCGVVLLFCKHDGKVKMTDAISWRIMLPVLWATLASGVSTLLQLKGAENLPATVLYPIVTGGCIIFSSLAGWIYFKEKLTAKMTMGVFLCFSGTCLFL